MARSGNRHLAVIFVASVALTGCEGGQSPFKKTSSATETGVAALETPAKPSSSVRLVDHDIEAPEVFQVTDEGLWDGRPSLGGVWVASPDAKDPERVIIRNPANGKFVIGALFRRERDNPGPKVQISSDAAEALGLLAGQPGQLNITALRREEAPTSVPDASQPILDGPETVATETAVAAAAPKAATPKAGATAPLDTAAMAAAIDKADGAAPADEALAGTAAVADATTEAAPKKKWWQRKKQPATDTAEAPLPDATAEAAAVTATAATEITAAPLPAAPSAAPAQAASGKSLIQLGIFSVEANAQRAADMVTKAGSPAEVRKEQSKGKPYWSVVAGPATTPAARDALMKKVKGLGFTDAYFVGR